MRTTLRILTTALILDGWTPRKAVATDCAQWGRFEIAFTNANTYADPYREVSLEATFTRPDGRKITFWGFHDGGQVWRLRFMPDLPGPWRYDASFSDGTPAGSGRFTCLRGNLPGPIAVHHANPVWFGRRDDDAVLLRGFHVGDRFFAANWSDASRTAFLDWAQAQGYNLLSCASHYLNREAKGRGRGWDTPRLWPLNAAEFARLEAILDDLARRNIVVYSFAGFFGRDSNFPRDPADQLLYVRYTYARLGAYPNLLLNVAGPEPLLRESLYLPRVEVNRLGAAIQAINIFGRPLSVHNRTGDDEFRDEPWLTYGTLQGPKTVNRTRMGRELLASHHPEKPLLAQETLWSGNTYHIRALKRDYSDDDLRKNTFVIHFSAAALVFADNDGDSSSGFTGSLDPKDARQERHDAVKRAWDLCASLPFAHLKPRPDLVQGNHAHCLAAPGRDYLVYLENSEPVSVRIEAGPYRVTWHDTRRPFEQHDGGRTADAKNLAPPPGGDDWVLQLTRPRSEVIRERDGRVAFEAEDGEGDWCLIPAPGGLAVQDPGRGAMRYKIEFTRAGHYYVFLFAKQGPAGGGAENDAILTLNGERLYGSDHRTRPEGMRVHGDWQWTFLPKGPGGHTPDAIRDHPVYFKVPAPGRCTLEIAHRSTNFAVDKVLLKLDDPAPPASDAASPETLHPVEGN